MGDGIKPVLKGRFVFGDMAAYYMLEEERQVELLLVPVQKEDQIREELFESKRLHGDSLVQVKILQKYSEKAHGFNRGMRARKLFANYRSMMSNRVEMLYR